MRKIFIICLFLLLFFFIGGISAQENIKNTNEIENTNLKNISLNKDINLESNDLEMYYKDGSKFKAKLVDKNKNSLSNKSILFTINGVTYERFTGNDGIAKLNINLDPKEYKIVSTFKENKNIVKMNKIKIKPMNISVIAPSYLELPHKAGTYTVKLVGGNNFTIQNKKLFISVNGVTYNRVSNSLGEAKLKINLDKGKYLVSVSVPKEHGYNDFNLKSSLLVKDFKTSLKSVSNLKFNYNKATYSVKLLDEKNKPINNGKIQFNINGLEKFCLTNIYGIASINLNNLLGDYKIFSKYIGNTSYKSCFKEDKITIVPMDYKLTANDLNFTYKDESFFSAYVVGADSKPLNNISVTFKVFKGNNHIKTFNTKTFENGEAKIKIDLDCGNYIIQTFLNEKEYKISPIKNHISILKQNISLESKNFILNRKGEAFTVKLLNKITKKPISNETVIIHVNGINYFKKTNENGIAKLNINLDNGKYTVECKLSDKNNFNCLNKKFLIFRTPASKKLDTNLIHLTNNINKKGEYFKVLLNDFNDIALKKQCVIIEVNGVKYKKFTDDTGIAKLKINLDDKSYIIKTFYEGSDLFYSSQNNSILKKNTSSDFIYSFRLKISKNETFKNKKVKIPILRLLELNINGKSHVFYYNFDYSTGTKILANKIYFVPYNSNGNNEEYYNLKNIKSQGISINLEKDELVIRYHGRLNNDINAFDVVSSKDRLYGYFAERMDLYLNNQLETSIKFADKLYFTETFKLYEDNGRHLINIPDSSKTSLITNNCKIEKTIHFSYGYNFFKNWEKDVPYETIQSFIISKVNVDNQILSKYLYSTNNSDINDNSLLGIVTLWYAYNFAEEISKKANVSWKVNEYIVLATKEWSGLSIHSTSTKPIVSGNLEGVSNFNFNYGLAFAISEKMAIELTGQEAKSAYFEILNGISSGKAFVIESDGENIILRLAGSNNLIKIDKKTYLTSVYTNLNISEVMESTNLKGSYSNVPISYKYPNSLKSITSKVFSGYTSLYHSISEFCFSNKYRAERLIILDDVMSGIPKYSSVLVTVSPSSAPAVAAINVAIKTGELMVYGRNKYVPGIFWQYLNIHGPIWKQKTIAEINPETGYMDFVEIPYDKDKNYIMDKAIYVDGRYGKRPLTEAEKTKYSNIDYKPNIVYPKVI